MLERIKTLRRTVKGGSTEFDHKSYNHSDSSKGDSSPKLSGRQSPHSSHSSAAETELKALFSKIKFSKDIAPPENFDIDHALELLLVIN